MGILKVVEGREESTTFRMTRLEVVVFSSPPWKVGSSRFEKLYPARREEGRCYRKGFFRLLMERKNQQPSE
jgi:hypothetical protein